MSDYINVEVDDKSYSFEKGVSLQKISLEVYGEQYKECLAAVINNEIHNLEKEIHEDSKIKFKRIDSLDGYRVYIKTISAVFITACKILFPNANVKIEHMIGNGLYATIDGDTEFTFQNIKLINKKMTELIEADIPINRFCISIDAALDLFKKFEYDDKIRLLKSLGKDSVDIYTIGDHIDSFHGYLAPSTAYVSSFKLRYYFPGVLILFPTPNSGGIIPEFNELKKLSKVFKETNAWNHIIDLSYVGSLNEKILTGKYRELIKISEALHEKKIASIADRVCSDDEVSLILIAGPSSSGKTTFAKRLQTQLKVNGKKPVLISVDDYFIDRHLTPKNSDGTFNFESIEAVDLKKLNEDLIRLLEGQSVELPTFNFISGKQEPSGNIIHVERNQPILVEGIHALNPKMTSVIPEKNKYKIYISALTQINLDAHNRIPTTEARFLRRLVRDEKFRGNNAIKTFEMWKSVRIGEEKNIFPFQEQADVMFDSALVYELSILKKHALPLLHQIKRDSIHYSEAKKAIKFLEYFIDIEDECSIPNNSILREFIGGICE